MDKVQIYYMCLLGLSLFGYGIRHGKSYVRKVNAYIELPLSVLFGLPIAGRIFGWW